MTFLIAAAGTGGHVFPGLSVGEALIDRGVDVSDILYVGGDRLEASIYPEHGFPFLQLEVRGLRRSMTPANLGIPSMVLRARNKVEREIVERGVKAALGLGGYVTVPVGLAARRRRVPFFCSEQNAEAGLASRLASRWSRTTFSSFPETGGLPGARWVGNPIRRTFWDFDRNTLRPTALARYGLDAEIPVLGVVGGSLGAGVLNRAARELVSGWDGPPIQVLHVTGERFLEEMEAVVPPPGVKWVRMGFESNMENFYAAVDLLVGRAGGAVAELTATATPSILVPGEFGSDGHQAANARFLTGSGAALTLIEEDLPGLPGLVASTLLDPPRLEAMAEACRRIARPHAALSIADALLEAAA